MKIKFQDARLSRKNKIRLDQVNEIVEQYAAQGYRLTLRQLYYRLVTKNIIANKVVEYNRLSHLLTEGRIGGVVDWDAIEDRVRTPHIIHENDSVENAIEEAESYYRLPRQAGQENYIELWVEKDAISNILKRKTEHYGIRLMVNRGYSSTTAMYDAFNRFQQAIRNGQEAYLFYLGDHDPSGLDMIKSDIPKRLEETFGTSVITEHIGITKPQINKFNPPPNPAKITDPRASKYIALHGDFSWEVDALEPETLHQIITKKVEAVMDMDKFNDVLKQEKLDKAVLRGLPEVRNKVIRLRDFVNERLENLGRKGTSDYSKLLEDFDELLG